MKAITKKIWKFKRKYQGFKETLREIYNTFMADNGELASLFIVIMCVLMILCLIGLALLSN